MVPYVLYKRLQKNIQFAVLDGGHQRHIAPPAEIL